MGGQKVQAPAGTLVLAPAGRGFCLEPIAEAARAAGHQAEEHEASSIPDPRAPASGHCGACLLRTGDDETNGGTPGTRASLVSGAWSNKTGSAARVSVRRRP